MCPKSSCPELLSDDVVVILRSENVEGVSIEELRWEEEGEEEGWE